MTRGCATCSTGALRVPGSEPQVTLMSLHHTIHPWSSKLQSCTSAQTLPLPRRQFQCAWQAHTDTCIQNHVFPEEQEGRSRGLAVSQHCTVVHTSRASMHARILTQGLQYPWHCCCGGCRCLQCCLAWRWLEGRFRVRDSERTFSESQSSECIGAWQYMREEA